MVSLSRSQYVLIVLLLLVVIAIAATTFMIANRAHFGVAEDTKEIFVDSEDGVVTYQDLNGNELSLESYLGQVLVVTSWASWSPFSATDLPALNDLARNYSGDVVFIAMNRKETKEQAARYLSTLPSLNNLLLVIDTEDKFYNRVDGYAMPETVIFDEQGVVVLHDRGSLSIANVEEALNNLLSDR